MQLFTDVFDVKSVTKYGSLMCLLKIENICASGNMPKPGGCDVFTAVAASENESKYCFIYSGHIILTLNLKSNR